MRRGELYDYGQAGATPASVVLLVSSDAVLENLNIPWVCGLDVISASRRDHLLCVSLPEVGWCDAVTPHKLYRPWLGAYRGAIDDDVLERVNMALRVALEL